MSTVTVESRTSNVAEPEPYLRIFSARLSYQMHRAVNPAASLEMDVLLSFLEGFAKDAAPEVAAGLAEGVELAMRCGGAA